MAIIDEHARSTQRGRSSTSRRRSRTSTRSPSISRSARGSSARAAPGALQDAHEAGVVAGSAEARAHGRRAERNEPRLLTHDRFGNRVDEVELDPSWHWLLGGAVARGIHSLPWRPRGPSRVPRGPRDAVHALVGDRRGRDVPGVDDLRGGSGAPRRRSGARRPLGAGAHRNRLRERRPRRHGDDRASGRLGRARQHHPGRARPATANGRCTGTSGSAPIRRAACSSRSPRRRRRRAVRPASWWSAGRAWSSSG